MEGGGLLEDMRKRLGGITGRLANFIPRPNKDEPVPQQPPQQSPQQSPPQQPSSSSMEANQGSAKESVVYATGMIRYKNGPPNLNPPPKRENPTIYAVMKKNEHSRTLEPLKSSPLPTTKRNRSPPPRQHGGRKTTRRRKQTNRRRRRSTRV